MRLPGSSVTENPSQVFLCPNCGVRAVSRDRGVYMVCGSEGDQEIVGMLEDFEAVVTELAKLQNSREVAPLPDSAIARVYPIEFRAQCDTVRLQLLRIGAQVRITVRKVWC
jgi:hypothetical protein